MTRCRSLHVRDSTALGVFNSFGECHTFSFEPSPKNELFFNSNTRFLHIRGSVRRLGATNDFHGEILELSVKNLFHNFFLHLLTSYNARTRVSFF